MSKFIGRHAHILHRTKISHTVFFFVLSVAGVSKAMDRDGCFGNLVAQISRAEREERAAVAFAISMRRQQCLAGLDVRSYAQVEREIAEESLKFQLALMQRENVLDCADSAGYPKIDLMSTQEAIDAWGV